MTTTKNFWKELKTPILALAPMANVTDAVFRAIIAKYSCTQCRRGAKHNLEHVERYVAWTEFVSVEALLSEGRDIALVDFYKLDKHAPTVAQIFGSKPEQFEKVARQIQEAGVFDGIDINMGCPDKG
ncbi:MAG: tRNA-dihydrouridine synthase [Candidatus Paceibacterota bacterium]